MGWLDTLLTWLLALLDWVCWPCRLVEWWVNLDGQAAATIVAGAFQAVAILGAAWIASRTADSIFSKRRKEHQYDLSTEIKVKTAKIRDYLTLYKKPLLLKSFENQNIKPHIIDFIKTMIINNSTYVNYFEDKAAEIDAIFQSQKLNASIKEIVGIIKDIDKATDGWDSIPDETLTDKQKHLYKIHMNDKKQILKSVLNGGYLTEIERIQSSINKELDALASGKVAQ